MSQKIEIPRINKSITHSYWKPLLVQSLQRNQTAKKWPTLLKGEKKEKKSVSCRSKKSWKIRRGQFLNFQQYNIIIIILWCSITFIWNRTIYFPPSLFFHLSLIHTHTHTCTNTHTHIHTPKQRDIIPLWPKKPWLRGNQSRSVRHLRGGVGRRTDLPSDGGGSQNHRGFLEILHGIWRHFVSKDQRWKGRF